MTTKIQQPKRPPRGAAKEKDKDYDDTLDGEASDETMEEQPEEIPKQEDAEKLDSAAESDEDYKAVQQPKNNHVSKITGPINDQRVREYLTVLRKHKECLEAPAAAILWIVDNGTVTRSKYQIPKTHHNPPRSDRERGGYAEILRSLGWKSNYANDGHYDWWMKPDEFDIVSFKEAVNTLRTSRPSSGPISSSTSSSSSNSHSHSNSHSNNNHSHHAPSSPSHPNSSPASTSHSSEGRQRNAKREREREREKEKEKEKEREREREKEKPIPEIKRERSSRATTRSKNHKEKEEDPPVVEEKPVIKRQRTLLREFVTPDEKLEDLETKFQAKKREYEECNVELDKLRKSIKDLQNKEKELLEKRDRCKDATFNLRTGLRIFKVREILYKMGDEGDQTRREIIEAERLQFTKEITDDKFSLKTFLADQRVRLEAVGDTSAITGFDTARLQLEDATRDSYQTEDSIKVFEWMSARASLAKQGVLHKLYQTFVEDVLQQKRDIPHVSLTASTRRADEALRKASEFEVKVAQNISNTDRTEETEKALKALIKSRDHQREECIAHISFLLAGPLREALEDTSPTKHAEFVKLQTYYIAKLRSSQAIKFEAETMSMLYDLSSTDEYYYVRDRLKKYQHNFPEVMHYLQLAAVGNLPTTAVHIRRVGSSGQMVVVGTKPYYLKELKDPSTVPSWPPQWLVDIEHISYILPIIGIREYDGRTYIQTPLQSRNLRGWLNDANNRTPKNIQRIFAQILFTLDWLGEYGKFLGSLKPENVFIASGNAVIDIASIFHTCDHRNDYAPVEGMRISYSTHAYDMWAIAMMLYEACFNKSPPHSAFDRDVIMKTPLAFEADPKFREWLADLLVTITSGFDGEHLTSHEALGHPFFASLFPSSPLSEARVKLSQLSIARTRTDAVGQVARTHIVPSIINVFADIERRKRAAFARWDMYVGNINTPSQPFTRELLALYFREVFTHGQLFVTSDTGRYLPNHSCSDSTPFVVLGYLTAKAALSGTPIQCQLAHTVFRYILYDPKEVLYTDLTQALADLYTFDTTLARQYKLNCLYHLPHQHNIIDDNGHPVTDETKERYYLSEINKKLVLEPKKQLEWIKQGFKEIAPVWDAVAKLDPTGLARVVCGRHWVDEGFLKQQLVFDPRVFFPPSPSRTSSTSLTPPKGNNKNNSKNNNNSNHHHHHHHNHSHPDVATPPADVQTTDPPPVLPSLTAHIGDPPSSPEQMDTYDASTHPSSPLTKHNPLTDVSPLSLNTAMYLHRVLDEWADARDRDRLAKFIYLCTNCVYIPWGGLGDGVLVMKSEDGAPHPHGSCNMLHLPEKNSYEAFREMLEDMVNRLDSWIYQLV